MEEAIEKVTLKFKDAWISVIQASSQKLAQLSNLLNKQPEACKRSIICECGRRSCPYRPVAVRTYIRKLKEA